MGEVTLGRISSEPNGRGEHLLKCPKCSCSFLSTIAKSDKTAELDNITCPACRFTEAPQHFIAAAHQAEVNDMAMVYITKELKKSLGKFKI